jgi:hypothetical protein
MLPKMCAGWHRKCSGEAALMALMAEFENYPPNKDVHNF